MNGKEWNSGYPSDPKCKEWMKKNLQDKVFGYPDVVRFSWRPVRDLLDDPEMAYKVTWEDEEEDEGQASITDFLGSSSNGKRKRQRLGGSKVQKGFERAEDFFF